MRTLTTKQKMSKLDKLQEELKSIGVEVLDFFQYLRSRWINKEVRGNLKIYVEKVLEKPIENIIKEKFSGAQMKKLDALIQKKHYNWGDTRFHINHRLTTYEDLVNIVGNIDPEIEAVVKKGYKLSIMPLALATKNKDLLSKFIPKKDFFTDHFAKNWDPYQIFSEKTKIYRKGVYIASQKFQRSILMNITSECPIGCVGCYKGFFTRVIGKHFYTNLSKIIIQTKLLVEHLNEHPEIKIVIVSGGEPLLLNNKSIAKMLKEFRRAKYLGELRICTGVIFQGLPFRIDDALLNMLEKFENETSIKINFNAHLGHPTQFTPEALVAVRKIIKRGFFINSQIPLQRNVNIFVENFRKTMETLYDLAKLQGVSGIRPYKYILHMNVGSLEYSVPLEFMLKVLGELKYRLDHPWPETWQPISYSILCRQGNIPLSPQLLYAIKKEVGKDKNSVIYSIPVPIANGKWRTVKYVEPLIRGYNDN